MQRHLAQTSMKKAPNESLGALEFPLSGLSRASKFGFRVFWQGEFVRRTALDGAAGFAGTWNV
jgi:hypothetical protein